MPQAAVTLPPGIEIFRAGRHTDDAGNVHEFSQADVQRMAEVYDPAQREAPLTVGHPAHNLPAYGMVARLTVNSDGRLAMDPHKVEPQFAEMVEAGRFSKRSASFYSPDAPNNPKPGAWYLRHVAFLGAQPPAIAGLKDIQFSEGDASGAVNFSETVATQEPDDMSKELQEQLAAEKAARLKAEAEAAAEKERANKAETTAASFAETARATRRASFVSFADAQVQAGKLLPKDKTMAVATLELLADSKPVEFSEGGTEQKVDPSAWLQGLISQGPKVVSFGEFAAGQLGEQQEPVKGKTDKQVDQMAKEHAAKHNVSYAEALKAVVSFTS